MGNTTTASVVAVGQRFWMERQLRLVEVAEVGDEVVVTVGCEDGLRQVTPDWIFARLVRDGFVRREVA